MNLNDAMALCYIDCSTGSLKINAARKLDADLWEADTANIRNYFKKIYNLYSLLEKAGYNGISKLLSRGYFKQALDVLDKSVNEKIKKKFALIPELFSELQGILSDEEISRGCSVYPYEWESVPARIIGEYCCWDSYYTVQLKNNLWDQHKNAYPYYIVQNWLGTLLESYSLNWNEDQAAELGKYYLREAINSLASLIPLLDIEEEKRLETFEIVNNTHDGNLELTLKQLKDIFNPMGVKEENKLLFWRNYRTDTTELINFYQYLDNETAASTILPEKVNKIVSSQTDPEKLVSSLYNACETDEEEKEVTKILNRVQKNIEKVAFGGFAEDVVVANYDAWIKYGGLDIDNQDSWTSEFWMLYYLRRFKKVMKSNSTYINGIVGRKGVSVGITDDLMTPPKRIAYYKEAVEHGLEENQKWVLDSNFNVNSADTKRWTSRIHTIPWNCLAAETRFRVNNTTMSIEEIYDEQSMGKHFWVFSITEDGQFNSKLNLINRVWIANLTDNLIEITLENGESIRVTPDHRLLLANGEFKEARKLTENDELEYIKEVGSC